jgi:hypothetical protein
MSLTAAACGAGGVADGPTVAADSSDRTTTPNSVEVALSLYVVLEADAGEASPLSSTRTEDGLRRIVERVATIWRGTGVTFAPIEIHTMEVPTTVLADLATGDPQPFLAGVGREFDLPTPGTINGFYVAELFDVNGFAPPDAQAFFVVDQPSVHDERVSSHEIGHILGLPHTLDDPGRLLFSGTNGMTLTDAEIAVAHNGAEALVDATP